MDRFCASSRRTFYGETVPLPIGHSLVKEPMQAPAPLPNAHSLSSSNLSTLSADRLHPLDNSTRCSTWIQNSLRDSIAQQHAATHVNVARNALLHGDPLRDNELDRHSETLGFYAEQGHASAWTALGALFSSNRYGVHDIRRATKCFANAASSGDPEAILELARIRSQTAATRAEKQAVIGEFARAYELGEAPAAIDIGNWITKRGRAVIDPEVAGPLLDDLQSAAAHAGQAAFAAGAAHEFGALGTTVSLWEAKAAYRRGLELRDPHAAAAFARLYTRGKLPWQEIGAPAVLHALEVAGDVHAGAAHVERGDIHFFAKLGRPKDDVAAMYAYERAARLHNPAGSAMFGFGYFSGSGGLMRDFTKAREFFEAAANAGDPRGLQFLIELLETPSYAQRDYARAARVREDCGH